MNFEVVISCTHWRRQLEKSALLHARRRGRGRGRGRDSTEREEGSEGGGEGEGEGEGMISYVKFASQERSHSSGQ